MIKQGYLKMDTELIKRVKDHHPDAYGVDCDLRWIEDHLRLNPHPDYLNAKGEHGMTAMDWACRNSGAPTNLIALLKAHGALLDTSHLMSVIAMERPTLVSQLCRLGVDVNQTDAGGLTPLYMAIMQTGDFTKIESIVEVLLEFGADVDAVIDTTQGSTIFMNFMFTDLFSSDRGLFILQKFIECKPDLNHLNSTGSTPAICMAGGCGTLGALMAFQALGSAGADFSVVNKHGDTALSIFEKRFKSHKDFDHSGLIESVRSLLV